MGHHIKAITGLGAVFLLLSACTDPAEMPDRTDGAAFFSQNCVACHGPMGRGDGPFMDGLKTKPTDLTQLSRENGGVFPAARALGYIYGDPAKSHLARVMPQFSVVMDEDDLVPVEIDGILTPTPRILAGLLAYLESIQE